MTLARFGSDPDLQRQMPVCLSALPIAYGSVPSYLADATVRGVLYEASRDEALVEVPDLARLHITREKIVVWPRPGCDAAALGVYLRRTPLMVHMMLVGSFASNGAAVAGPDGAVVLMGVAGTGKSTLAAALLKCGLRLLADDAAPLVLGADGRAHVLPVWPELLLWPKTISGLFGEPPDWLGPEGAGIPFRSVAADRFENRPMPLKALYVLAPDKLGDAITQIASTGFSSLLRCMLIPYQPELAAALADPARLLALYGAVSATRNVSTIDFPKHDVGEMDELARRIIGECGWSSATGCMA